MNIFLALLLTSISLISCGSNSGNRETKNRGPAPAPAPESVTQTPEPVADPVIPTEPESAPQTQTPEPVIAKSPIDLTKLEENLTRIEYNYNEFELGKDDNNFIFSYKSPLFNSQYKVLLDEIVLKADEGIYKYKDNELLIEFNLEKRALEISFNNIKYIITMYKKAGSDVYPVSFDYNFTKAYDALEVKDKVDTINNRIMRHISKPIFSSFTNKHTFHLYTTPLMKGNMRASYPKNNGELSGDTQFVNISINEKKASKDYISFSTNSKPNNINVKVIKNDHYETDGEVGKGIGNVENSEAWSNEKAITDHNIPFYYYVMKRQIEKVDI